MLKDMMKELRKMCKNDDTCVALVFVCLGLLLCALFNRDGFAGAPLDWDDNLSQLLSWGTIKKFFGFGPMSVPRELSKQRMIEGESQVESQVESELSYLFGKKEGMGNMGKKEGMANWEKEIKGVGDYISEEISEFESMFDSKTKEGMANLSETTAKRGSPLVSQVEADGSSMLHHVEADGSALLSTMESEGSSLLAMGSSKGSCSPGVPVNGLKPKIRRPEQAAASMTRELGIMNNQVSPQDFGCSGNKEGIVGLPSEVMSYGGISAGYTPADLEFEGASVFEYMNQAQATDPVPLSMSGDKNTGSFGKQGQAYNVTLYYAPWCPHCKKMVPDFKEFQRQHHGKTLGDKLMDIVMVNSDEEPEKVKAANVQGFPEVMVNGKSEPGFPRREKNKMKDFVESM